MGRPLDEDVVLKEIGRWIGYLDEDMIERIKIGIKKLPEAQQWISCSETEIEPDHEVLCCDKYGEEILGWLAYIDDQWLCESETEVMYAPVAWMEKPKPWKGEQHE